MTAFTNINTPSLIKHALNVGPLLKRFEDSSPYAQIPAKNREDQNLDHKRLKYAKNATTTLDPFLILAFNIAQKNVHIQIEKEPLNGWQHLKRDGRQDFSSTTLIKVKLYGQNHAKNAALNQKELKAHTLIIQKSFGLDGYVNHVIFAGIKLNRSKVRILSKSKKFTGQKAKLLTQSSDNTAMENHG